jgi:hypothetical protein
MKNSQTILFSAIAVVAALSIMSIAGITIKDIIAEETENVGYSFAEDVMITGVFSFKDGTELVNFEVFNSGSDYLNPKTLQTIELMKVVGETPLLHKAVDESRKYNVVSSAGNFQDRFFDVNITLSQGGSPIRVYAYRDCSIVDFSTVTEFDKEEGWLQKAGFAVIENYELQCEGLTSQNPSYEQMMSSVKADTQSTMDLRDTQQWSDIYKYFK